MDEFEEYNLNIMRINGIKNTLLEAGYQYDDIHKWYLPDGVKVRKDQEEYFNNARPLFNMLITRNNVLKKKLGI